MNDETVLILQKEENNYGLQREETCITSMNNSLYQFILPNNNKLDDINRIIFSPNNIHPITIILFLILSSVISVIGVFPYVNPVLLLDNWILFCVIRPFMYAFIFFSTWCKLFGNFFSNNTRTSIQHIPRYFINSIFAIIYSVMYSIKWMETDGIYIKYVAIFTFSISWFIVYYEVMDKFLISRTSNDNLNNRRKRILLFCIKESEIFYWNSDDASEKIYSTLIKSSHIATLLCKNKNSIFHNNEESILSLYENDAYDPYQDTRNNIVNILLGFSLLLLTLAITEDYGYPLRRLIPDHHSFLWVIMFFCFLLSALYLVATYPIYHNTLKNIYLLFDKHHTKRILLSFFVKIPLSFLAIIAAFTRMNSSYSIFGMIAGKLGVPLDLGLFLIWSAVIIVALVDYSASMKILTRCVKYIFMTVCLFLSKYDFFPPIIQIIIHKYVIRYYSKKLKFFIRTCNNKQLGNIANELL